MTADDRPLTATREDGGLQSAVGGQWESNG
jgi:hypothetical protein